ncbi:MAG: Copper amine oxidase N-terminal domain [Armatimonadetes bacterium]|nr:Copper amine oxidase N-terminal domain [Armatimonadota bacterium]
MNSQCRRGTAIPVLIAVLGLTGARGALAQRDSIDIPEDTVIRVKLADDVSSVDSRVGDRILARVTSTDRSGFPDGTRIEGQITEVQRSTDKRPGVVDMDFRRAVLPDGRTISIDGRLASLSEEDIRRGSDGRVLARRNGSGSKFEPKWVGYGAGAGAVLATVFGSSFLKGALLGGLGGAVYGYLNRDKDRRDFRDVTLDEGTEFGVRLRDRVAFEDRDNYRYTFRPGDPDERVLGDREERVFGDREPIRRTPTVRLNGRALRFDDARPQTVNGTLFVPLSAIAREANLRYSRNEDDDTFVVQTRNGPVRGRIGEVELSGRGVRDQESTLLEAPMRLNGEVYVPVDFLTQVMELRANWNRQGGRLDLETYR